MRMFKRVAARLSLVVFGFLLVEIGLRLAGISFPIFDAYDHDRALKLMPGKEGIYAKEGRSHLKINGLGYRDVEHERAKPDGVFRIAVLGDSFTEARQVEIEETYWKRLETILNDDLELDPAEFEVLNFGIGGYGQTEELLTLRKDALAFSPDLVLVGFFSGNDLVNNLKSLNVRFLGEDFRPFYVLQDDELVLDSSFRDLSLSSLRRRFLLTTTHYVRTLEVVNQVRRLFAVQRMKAAAAARAESEAAAGELEDSTVEVGISGSQFVPPPNEEWAAAWAVTEALLAEMNRESVAAGARFAVLPITTQSAVHPAPEARARFAREMGVPDLLYSEKWLERIGKKHGFEVLNITERLQVEATEQNIYLHGFENTALGTGHWNQQAHALVAEMVAHDLLALGLVGVKQPALPSFAGKQFSSVVSSW